MNVLNLDHTHRFLHLDMAFLHPIIRSGTFAVDVGAENEIVLWSECPPSWIRRRSGGDGPQLIAYKSCALEQQ